jgi:hypothetical protein
MPIRSQIRGEIFAARESCDMRTCCFWEKKSYKSLNRLGNLDGTSGIWDFNIDEPEHCLK